MPASTADRVMNSARVCAASTRASVVLPVPGGPQKIIERGRSASMATRSGLPGASR